MKSRGRRKNVPILLNYTGETVRINLRENEDRFKSQTGNVLILPSLGKPKIEVLKKLEKDALFASEIHIVHGIPPPMHGVFYIVQDHIAKLLYGIRDDLLILYEKRAENAGNSLKPEEMVLVGDDFAYFSVDFVSD
jgi:hypothetical protein